MKKIFEFNGFLLVQVFVYSFVIYTHFTNITACSTIVNDFAHQAVRRTFNINFQSSNVHLF